MTDNFESIQYNQEEVQELFDVVFKLSAKDIHDKLTKVSNRIDIAKRRWFWELLQNAKDAVNQNETVSVKLCIESDDNNFSLKFKHNGNPFRYQDAKNLIFPYSDKEEETNSDKSGRFGTGFLATHVLSNKIEVTGIYLKDQKAYDFDFTLDRSGKDKTEIASSINDTWQEFRTNRTEKTNYIHEQRQFDTTFNYSLDETSIKIVNDSIADFEISLPYTLAFIPKICSIDIEDNLNNSKIHFELNNSATKKLTENIKEYVIEKRTLKDSNVTTEFIKVLVCSDGVIDIAIETKEDSNGKVYVKQFQTHQPILFCQFPLIGASDFKFPVIVNSASFLPKEERDGIWLDNVGYGLTNQPLFEQVIPLYKSICNYASEQDWGDCYLLLKSLNENFVISDFNSKWFKDKIQTPLKTFALQVKLVDSYSNGKLPISFNEQKVYFQDETKEENRNQLWEFIKALYPNNIPRKNDIHFWYEIFWDECPKFSINSFTKHIAKFKNIETLKSALSLSNEDSLKWLNSYVDFISKIEPALLNSIDSAILPNQQGIFKRKDDVYLDDGSIDDELKEILAITAKFKRNLYDWRSDLLEKKIYLDLPLNKTRGIKDIGILISENVRELLKDDNPSTELRELFSKTLNWLTDKPTEAKEYFKGLKTDTLLYKSTSDNKIRFITEMIEKDRKGEVSFEEQSSLLNNPVKIALLKDPDIELKVKLGEQVLADRNKEKVEFEFKKKTGDIFESIFRKIIENNSNLSIQKVEGEEDFIITNTTNVKFYIELKSIKDGEQQIQMTHKQAKKAHSFPNNYFLCIIPNNGQLIDEEYFKTHALFDNTIGSKLTKKVNEALVFETPETGISVEFEDSLLQTYSKYRYKFNIAHNLWGKLGFNDFISKLQ